MRAFIIRRTLLVIPILIGVTLLIFSILQLFTPEQRAASYVVGTPRRPEVVQKIIDKYHLDAPVHVQYFYWLNEVLHGNLGIAGPNAGNMPVLTAMVQAFPATFELVIFSIPSTVLLGIYLGVKSAVNRDKPIDHATRVLSIIGWSLPTFWFALILIAVFYGGLGWVSTGRLSNEAFQVVTSSGFVRYTGVNSVDGLLNGQLWITVDALKHIILPVLCLTIVQVALIIRVMRSSMLEALGKGYIITARAKGLTKNEVVNKHARRNALIPVVTLSGILAAGLLCGVVITETCFDYMGLGYYAAHAAMQIDIPSVLGFSLFVGVMFTFANLIVDVTYAYIDPRIRLA
ncbi:MAG: ABC transporter permease [Thermoproteota archaeon]|nr:ABC transporter permease [Thermoproteota archaeon]